MLVSLSILEVLAMESLKGNPEETFRHGHLLFRYYVSRTLLTMERGHLDLAIVMMMDRRQDLSVLAEKNLRNWEELYGLAILKS
jgi:hypothetical protein